MTIARDKMVSLTYELRVDGKEGEVFETAGRENPLTFLYGAGLMLPMFEERLAGLSDGAVFDVEIPAKDAYGEVNEEAIINLPKHIFEVNGEFDGELVKPGNTVPMMSTSGQRMNGIVLAVEDDTVRMDFNHPLAGEDLFFKGEVLEVRDATAEELAAVYNQGGCGCGSGGGCGSGSCSTDEHDHEHEHAHAGGGCGCGSGGGSCGC